MTRHFPSDPIMRTFLSLTINYNIYRKINRLRPPIGWDSWAPVLRRIRMHHRDRSTVMLDVVLSSNPKRQARWLRGVTHDHVRL